ncbi:immune inhibitor A domain-containing protein [Pseudomarimonas arenosa]|uniref:Immune inhibitor A n=1 Tax=Pseudomarimonas arenosa TaxID=2774145 RepID=A0AAW3ZMK9_9GAMM|nr:immune inhibitor A domain-containing protein [Pseudomarimonas arenosa]MBD8526715.1 immune inhibitor A [Pseudomarimonas arenosa]
MRKRRLAALLLAATPMAYAKAPYADKVAGLDSLPGPVFKALDREALAREDALYQVKGHAPIRFAIGRDVKLSPNAHGSWRDDANGMSVWRLKVTADEAAHLNFGFRRIALPVDAELTIYDGSGESRLGPYRSQDISPTGQLWTPVLQGDSAMIEVTLPTAQRDQLDLELNRIGQGYRGFGHSDKVCKSGACNTDVACLGESDPWNGPRRAVAAITVNGTDTCTGSLLNNTANDHRMLFATATHCGISNDSAAQSTLVYWLYESATCRTPGSSASGTALPKPSRTTQGLRFLAQTANPFAGSAPAGDRSDFTLIELNTPPPDNDFELHWAGWDRRAPPTTCSAPTDPSSTVGLCASIHHPSVDEKRITFVESNLILGNISGAANVHWRANWDPTPPILPNIPAPQPTSLPPSVTEPGSSGSPLYNAEQRLVGVLSGGASACGVGPGSLNDEYGGLFHAWEGLGTATTRMRDYLDPTSSNANFIDGIDECTPPDAPTMVQAVANGDNRIDISWAASSGAATYRVLRSDGTCPGGSFSVIDTVAGTSLSDLDVSGGSSYSYRLQALGADACPSTQSSCVDAAATGVCNAPPTFAGLTAASSADTAQCGINLSWGTASGSCGMASSIVYNVYRSTSPGFEPSSGNRFASCLTSNSLLNLNVEPDTTYHYLVLAEDLGSAGAGPCGGGREDTNRVYRSAEALGLIDELLADDVESGDGLWTMTGSGGGSNFAIVETAAHSPTHAWFVANASSTSDRQLNLASPLVIPGGAQYRLEFQHQFATENRYDGAVLEYSLNGTTWTDITAANGAVPANANRFISGAYTQTMNSGSAIAGRSAWTGNSGSFVPVQVDLSDFAGQTVHLRFRFASDSSIGGTGWWIDTIRVLTQSSCTAESFSVFWSGFEGS